MNFRQLECFMAVAEDLHFGRAAQRLRLGQASVSEAVRGLERDLGAPLFERTSRRVSLTRFGMAFLRDVREPYEALRGVYILAQASTRQADELVIGHTPALGQLLLPGLVATARDADSDGWLRWRPVQMHTHAQIRAVTEGRIDIGLCWAPRVHAPLRADVLARCPFVALLSADDPLAVSERLKLSDLRDRSLVISPRQDNLFIDARLRAALIQAGLGNSSIDEVLGYEELAIHVAVSGRIALHPATVSLANRVPNVVCRPLDEPDLELEICAVRRSDSPHPEILRAVDLLCDGAPRALQAIVQLAGT